MLLPWSASLTFYHRRSSVKHWRQPCFEPEAEADDHQRPVLYQPKSSPFSTICGSRKISLYIHYLPVIPAPCRMTFKVWSYVNSAMHQHKTSPKVIITKHKMHFLLLFLPIWTDTLPHRPLICFYPIWSTHGHLQPLNLPVTQTSIFTIKYYQQNVKYFNLLSVTDRGGRGATSSQ